MRRAHENASVDRGSVAPSEPSRLAIAMEAAGLGDWEADLAANTIFLSARCCALFGRPGPSLLSNTEFAMWHSAGDLKTGLQAVAEARADHRGEFRFEIRALWPDGSVHWHEVYGRFLYDASGCAVRTVGVNRDITMERAAELRRNETAARFAAIVDSATDAIVSVDEEQRIVLFNNAAIRMFGCSAEEAIGTSIERFLPERYRSVHRVHIREFTGRGATELGFGRSNVLWAQRRDGSEFPIEASLSRATVDGEHLYTAVIRDISERLAMERARAEADDATRVSEERYRCLVDATSHIVWVTTPEGQLVPPQITWTAYTGQREEDIDGDGWFNAVHPDDRDRTVAAWTSALSNGTLYEIEHRIRRADGEYRLMQGRAIPLRNEDGQIREWVGLHEDVTEVRADATRLAIAVEAAQFGDWGYEFATETVYRSERSCQFAGRPGPIRCHLSAIESWHYPGELVRGRKSIADAIVAGKHQWTEEYRLVRPDGAIRWIRAFGRILYDGCGKPQRMVGVARDITDDKEAELALLLSEKRYRSLVEATAQIVWTSDSEGALQLPQPGWTAFTGQTDEDMLRDSRSSCIHPDDRPQAIETWTHALQTGTVWESEHRLRRHDGEYRVMSARALPVLNDDGSILEWVGIHTDITDRRVMDRKQRQFIVDVLFSVSEGRLRLHEFADDLPPMPAMDGTIPESSAFELAPETLAEVRRRIRVIAASIDFPEDRAMAMLSAASECAMNAVTHGARATCQIVAEGDGSLIQVWVRDQGRGIDMSELPKATLMKGYSGIGGAGGFGHGFYLMLAYVDAIHLLTGSEGTTVVLEQWRIPPVGALGF